jgi:hypothetical protein
MLGMECDHATYSRRVLYRQITLINRLKAGYMSIGLLKDPG